MSSRSMIVISLSGGATVESAHRNGFKGRSDNKWVNKVFYRRKNVKLVVMGEISY